MTQSVTPAIVITQTGGAQLVLITPSATASQTPNPGIALEAEDQTVVITP